MHKKIPIVDLEIDSETGHILKIGTPINIDHLPLGTFTNNDIDRVALREWWKSRCIPQNRDGIDILEKINIHSPQSLSCKYYGLSLSDHYWICPKDQAINWNDINFFANPFSYDVSDLLFNSEYKEGSRKFNFCSPDCTTSGQLRKKWKIINGDRYLLKKGSLSFKLEIFNEVIATSICSRLDIGHSMYTLSQENGVFYCMTKNFLSPTTELVTATSIFNQYKLPDNISRYEHYIACGEMLGIKNMRWQVEQMLILDFIMANSDRNFDNFGLIRNAETLEWVGVSPVFDCGSSLFFNKSNYSINLAISNADSKPFRSKHREQIKLVRNIDVVNLNSLSSIGDEYSELLSQDQDLTHERRSLLCKGLTRRIQILKKYAQATKF
jgi:hypothetical protein